MVPRLADLAQTWRSALPGLPGTSSRTARDPRGAGERRRRDLNPRGDCSPTALAGRRTRPDYATSPGAGPGYLGQPTSSKASLPPRHGHRTDLGGGRGIRTHEGGFAAPTVFKTVSFEIGRAHV